mmetsp:Transcript_10192/g.25857  ORF Transcript_10192/g.25857 Transcript_10192/m.25857 type:complete len:172 (+) Transcript_10192:385-900(+)
MFSNVKRIGLYVSCPNLKEVETQDLLRICLDMKKDCFVPKLTGKREMQMLKVADFSDLRPAPPFNILEPDREDPATGKHRPEAMDEGLDLLLVPGLAFSAEGKRLGRGGGYYDSYIEKLLQKSSSEGNERPLIAGLAFSCQVVPDVPCDSHDMEVDAIFTAADPIDCKGKL